MTFIGKLFVLTTFVLSLLFLALALGVYVNHLPWHADQKQGIVEKLQTKIEQHAYSAEKGSAKYQENFNLLARRENKRKARQQYYAVAYEQLRTGKDAQGADAVPPIPELIKDADGDIVYGKNPVKSKVITGAAPEDAALLPQISYAKEIATVNKQIAEERVTIAQRQKQLADLTTVMQGEKETPGLIRDKETQVDARKPAENQQ